MELPFCLLALLLLLLLLLLGCGRAGERGGWCGCWLWLCLAFAPCFGVWSLADVSAFGRSEIGPAKG
jgi:hypothetical protein